MIALLFALSVFAPAHAQEAADTDQPEPPSIEEIEAKLAELERLVSDTGVLMYETEPEPETNEKPEPELVEVIDDQCSIEPEDEPTHDARDSRAADEGAR